MAYSKQTFTNGQTLKAEDLNKMSEGIVEALGKSIPNALKYQDNAQINDGTGALETATAQNTRTTMYSLLAVNKGDTIVINNENIKFIAYAFQTLSTDSFLGYIDTNPSDSTSSLKNWGNNFTFTNTLTINGASVTPTYPIYVRLVFRNLDGISVIHIDDFKDAIKYSITADNSHLFEISAATSTSSNMRVASPFLTTNLISHRGLCSVAPENTLSAAQKAFEAGIKIIEMDVQMTSDHVPVLLHDTTIDRTSNGSGAISSLTYEQASQYDYGSWKNAAFAGEKLPKLEEFLVWCKTRGICAELDLANRGFTAAQKRVIYDIVLNLGMIDSTLFTATGNELEGYLSFNPNIIISVSGITSLSIAQSTLPSYVTYGLVFPSIPIANLSKDLVAYIHTLNMKAKTWTIDDTTTRDTALSYGVDAILSDELTTLY